MFSLIISVLSIILVGLLAAASFYYLESKDRSAEIAAGSVAANALNFDSGLVLYRADLEKFPDSLDVLVQETYLTEVPRPVLATYVQDGALLSYSSKVYEQVRPNSRSVILKYSVREEVCREINKLYNKTNVIEENITRGLAGQCFGESAPYSFIWFGDWADADRIVDDYNADKTDLSEPDLVLVDPLLIPPVEDPTPDVPDEIITTLNYEPIMVSAPSFSSAAPSYQTLVSNFTSSNNALITLSEVTGGGGSETGGTTSGGYTQAQKDFVYDTQCAPSAGFIASVYGESNYQTCVALFELLDPNFTEDVIHALVKDLDPNYPVGIDTGDTGGVVSLDIPTYEWAINPRNPSVIALKVYVGNAEDSPLDVSTVTLTRSSALVASFNRSIPKAGFLPNGSFNPVVFNQRALGSFLVNTESASPKTRGGNCFPLTPDSGFQETSAEYIAPAVSIPKQGACYIALAINTAELPGGMTQDFMLNVFNTEGRRLQIPIQVSRPVGAIFRVSETPGGPAAQSLEGLFGARNAGLTSGAPVQLPALTRGQFHYKTIYVRNEGGQAEPLPNVTIHSQSLFGRTGLDSLTDSRNEATYNPILGRNFGYFINYEYDLRSGFSFTAPTPTGSYSDSAEYGKPQLVDDFTNRSLSASNYWIESTTCSAAPMTPGQECAVQIGFYTPKFTLPLDESSYLRFEDDLYKSSSGIERHYHPRITGLGASGPNLVYNLASASSTGPSWVSEFVQSQTGATEISATTSPYSSSLTVTNTGNEIGIFNDTGATTSSNYYPRNGQSLRIGAPPAFAALGIAPVTRTISGMGCTETTILPGATCTITVTLNNSEATRNWQGFEADGTINPCNDTVVSGIGIYGISNTNVLPFASLGNPSTYAVIRAEYDYAPAGGFCIDNPALRGNVPSSLGDAYGNTVSVPYTRNYIFLSNPKYLAKTDEVSLDVALTNYDDSDYRLDNIGSRLQPASYSFSGLPSGFYVAVNSCTQRYTYDNRLTNGDSLCNVSIRGPRNQNALPVNIIVTDNTQGRTPTRVGSLVGTIPGIPKYSENFSLVVPGSTDGSPAVYPAP